MSFSLLLSPLSIHCAGLKTLDNIDSIYFYTWNPIARHNDSEQFLKICEHHIIKLCIKILKKIKTLNFQIYRRVNGKPAYYSSCK